MVGLCHVNIIEKKIWSNYVQRDRMKWIEMGWLCDDKLTNLQGEAPQL